MTFRRFGELTERFGRTISADFHRSFGRNFGFGRTLDNGNTIWGLGCYQKYHPLARGLRATPSALGLRDGIFDTTLAPIWYFYITFISNEITEV